MLKFLKSYVKRDYGPGKNIILMNGYNPQVLNCLTQLDFSLRIIILLTILNLIF